MATHPTKKINQQASSGTTQAAEMAAQWQAVPSTLRIPLAGRALGGSIFPSMAINDQFAAKTLQAIGDDGSRWINDRYSVWGVLARTRFLRDQALRFMQTHPQAHFVNIGCGLSQYFQWLDNGQTRMTDADLPEVLAVREQLLPPLNERHRMLPVDVTAPDWWQQLQLGGRDAPALFLMMEGVSMYLQKEQILALLQTVGEQAPTGSVMVLDAFCGVATGQAHWHASLRHTGANLSWGLRCQSEFEAAHPRLRLDQTFDFMAAYDWMNAMVNMGFAMMTGVPFYALYVLRVV